MLKIISFLIGFICLPTSLFALELQEAFPRFILEFVPKKQGLSAAIIPGSEEMTRYEDSLLLPKALVKIKAPFKASRLGIQYMGKVRGFQRLNEKSSEARFYASFLEAKEAVLLLDGKPYATLNFEGEKQEEALIDNGCFTYHLETQGMEGELLSLGCRKSVYGEFGNEESMLQVFWAAGDWKPRGGEEGVHLVNLYGKAPSTVALENNKGEQRELKLWANPPKKRPRLLTALGLGPYQYLAKRESKIHDDAVQFMYMLYGKFVLSEKNSFKLFDAYIEGTSKFNNLGLYFSSDVAKLWNNRIVINTLLGAQDLFFELPGAKQHKIIYPQGIEMIFHHAFGLKNYKLMAGGFVALGAGLDYSNVWLRFGKGVFYELNYLKWAEDESKAEALGLSVGIPFFSAF